MAEAADQPKDGDTVLHCGHAGLKRAFHCWMAPAEIKFKRPNGTDGASKWIAACSVCTKNADRDPRRIVVRGDGIWQGNEPAFEK